MLRKLTTFRYGAPSAVTSQQAQTQQSQLPQQQQQQPGEELTQPTDADLIQSAHIEARRAIEAKLTSALAKHATELSLLTHALQSEKQLMQRLIADHAEEIHQYKMKLAEVKDELDLQQQTYRVYVNDTTARICQLEVELTASQHSLAQTRCDLHNVTARRDSLYTRATADASKSSATILALELRVCELQVQLNEKRQALQVYHEQIEYNTKKREKAKEDAVAAAIKADEKKKQSFSARLAKKLHLEDKPPVITKQQSLGEVNMFSPTSSRTSADDVEFPSDEDADAGTNDDTNSEKQRQDELAEEVAISLTKRLQESEHARLALEEEVQRLRQKLTSSPSATNSRR